MKRIDFKDFDSIKIVEWCNFCVIHEESMTVSKTIFSSKIIMENIEIHTWNKNPEYGTASSRIVKFIER